MIDWSRTSNRDFREIPPKLGTMSLLLATLAFVLTWITAPDYGIGSDVGNYFASSLRLLAWFREFFSGVLSGRPTAALDTETVFEAWRWYLPRLPHPPVARELSGFTWLLAHRWTDTLTAYRIAVMLAYAMLIAWVTVFTHWSLRSRLAGLSAGLATLVYPTLFAHGHLAHTDLFLTLFWFGAGASIVVFERTRRIGWLVAAGLLTGAAAATKFSGLLLVPVLAAWLLARRPRQLGPAVFIAALAGVTLFFAVNPVAWIAPEVALSDYFGAGTARAAGEMTRLRTEYFGRIYEFRPPFHYPWVWTLIVIPPSLLAAAVVGLAGIRRSWLVSFCLLNMGVLYAALLLPSAPLHDGVRLFLPALPFQCVLVGFGVLRSIDWLAARLPSVGRPWIEALVVIGVIAPAGAVTARVHPYQLSYANFLVGGTAGAEARGLEVTNLKEAFSPRVLLDLARIIPDDAVVDPGFMAEELCFYQAQGYAPRWRVETDVVGPDGSTRETLSCRAGSVLPIVLPRPAAAADFVFVLNREAVWRPVDRALFLYGGAPAYEISLAGVPLFRAYRLRE